jgi:hypothetical protein
MYDALSALQASVTKTSSFDSTGVDLVNGTPLGGLPVRLLVTAASGTNPTLDVVIQHSDDDNTYTDLVTFDQVTDTGESFRLVETTKPYIRASATIAADANPSFTYQVEIGPALAA